MEDKKIGKEAFELAQKEAREEKIKQVKEVIVKTLEKLDNIKKQIKELKEQEKILKLDIEDLKNGKLDLIAERQLKDKKAKEVSVVTIIKEKTVNNNNFWYQPYQLMWIGDSTINSYYYDDTTIYNSASTCLLENSGTSGITINCSLVKDAAVGTYLVNGHVVNLR